MEPVHDYWYFAILWVSSLLHTETCICTIVFHMIVILAIQVNRPSSGNPLTINLQEFAMDADNGFEIHRRQLRSRLQSLKLDDDKIMHVDARILNLVKNLMRNDNFNIQSRHVQDNTTINKLLQYHLKYATIAGEFRKVILRLTDGKSLSKSYPFYDGSFEDFIKNTETKRFGDIVQCLVNKEEGLGCLAANSVSSTANQGHTIGPSNVRPERGQNTTENVGLMLDFLE